MIQTEPKTVKHVLTADNIQVVTTLSGVLLITTSEPQCHIVSAIILIVFVVLMVEYLFLVSLPVLLLQHQLPVLPRMETVVEYPVVQD